MGGGRRRWRWRAGGGDEGGRVGGGGDEGGRVGGGGDEGGRRKVRSSDLHLVRRPIIVDEHALVHTRHLRGLRRKAVRGSTLTTGRPVRARRHHLGRQSGPRDTPAHAAHCAERMIRLLSQSFTRRADAILHSSRRLGHLCRERARGVHWAWWQFALGARQDVEKVLSDRALGCHPLLITQRARLGGVIRAETLRAEVSRRRYRRRCLWRRSAGPVPWRPSTSARSAHPRSRVHAAATLAATAVEIKVASASVCVCSWDAVRR